jgi:glycosyltransferase involved in cell wall biosynthesis
VNLLLFSPTFAPDRGGAESLAEDLGALLAGQGHAVSVVTQSDADPGVVPDAPERSRGMQVWRVPVPPPHWPLLASPSVLVADLRLSRWYRGLLARQGIEAVCLARVDESCRHLLRVTRACGVRLSVYLHGGELRDLQRRWPRARLVLRRALRDAAAVVAVSEELRSEAAAFAPEDAAKVRVVPNGIDVRAVRSTPPIAWPRPYVLFAGRLEPVKNAAFAIDAFGQVARRVAPLDLLIVGTGSEAPVLAGQARLEGVADRVHFLGPRDRAEVWGLMRGAHCVVVPSRAEGHPLVVLEAWAAGVPVLASAVKGLRDLVGPDSGALFDLEDPARLAALLVRFTLGDPEVTAIRARLAALDCGAFDLAASLPAHLEAIAGSVRV